MVSKSFKAQTTITKVIKHDAKIKSVSVVQVQVQVMVENHKKSH